MDDRKPTNTQVRAIVSELCAKVGIEPCGDNSCVFGPPGGMGTNGGCRCVIERAPGQRQQDRRTIHALASLVRELATRVTAIEPVADDTFYILSLKWTREDLATWWMSKNSGYTSRLDDAGRYSREHVETGRSTYDNGDSTIAIPCAKVDAAAVRVVSTEKLAELIGQRLKPILSDPHPECETCGEPLGPQVVLGQRVLSVDEQAADERTAALWKLKHRARHAFAGATVKHPDGVMQEFVDAIDALPDRTLFDRLAPEFRAPFEEELTKIGIMPAKPPPVDQLKPRRRTRKAR